MGKPNIEITYVRVFNYKSTLSFVREATECANKVINDKSFKAEVEAKIGFDYSEDNGSVVLNKLLNHACVVRSYRTTNPWSKVYATTYKSNTIDLYLNSRKSQSTYGWSGTVIHECSHNVGYSHGNNSSVGKGNTVPYWIGNTAKKHAERICN